MSASSGVIWMGSVWLVPFARGVDDEIGGLAGLVLQIGEQRGNGVELEAVDGEDLVAGLQAGTGGGHVGLKRVDLDGGVLHLGNEAELVEGEVVGTALGFERRAWCRCAGHRGRRRRGWSG